MNRRHTIQRKSQIPDYPTPDYPTPATPTFISLEFRRGVLYKYPRRAGVPYIYKRCFLLTMSVIGWPVQTGRTIHFNNKLYNHPSPGIRTNPSNGRIYHYLCNIVHNELGDLGVGWSLNRPTTAIRFSKEHRHNPVMV